MHHLVNDLRCVEESPNLIAALAYAKMGWAVLPLHYITELGCSCSNRQCSSPAKHPLTARGSLDASTDASIIRRWWQRQPLANVGIATGKSSELVVVDIDPRHGGDKSWLDWSAANPL